MTDVETTPFEQLIKMIERELELAGQGRTRELQDAVTRTGVFMQTLPTPAPPSAQSVVRRAQALRGRVAIETRRLRDGLEITRASLRRGRRLNRKYNSSGPQPGRRYSASV